MAPLLAGGADPNLPLDKEGSTLLHAAQTPEEIKMVLTSPLVEVNATNEVRRFLVDLLLTIDTRSHMLSDSQILHARLITTPTIPGKHLFRLAKRRSKRTQSRLK